MYVDDIEDGGEKKKEGEGSRYLSLRESGVIKLKFTLFSYSLYISFMPLIKGIKSNKYYGQGELN